MMGISLSREFLIWFPIAPPMSGLLLIEALQLSQGSAFEALRREEPPVGGPTATDVARVVETLAADPNISATLRGVLLRKTLL